MPRKRNEKKWEEYLTKLEEDSPTAWIKGQEKAVEVLESLAGNGYQPDDNLRFELVTNHGKRPESSNAEANAENQVKIFYRTEEGREFDTEIWKKTRANYYSYQCQGIVQEIENKIREVGPGEYPQWPEKINEIIGVLQPQQEGMTTEQWIEEFVALIADDGLAEKAIDNIHKIAVNERAIYRSINGKWQDNLITPQQRRDIFYCSQLDDDIEETKQTWRLLSYIEEALSLSLSLSLSIWRKPR